MTALTFSNLPDSARIWIYGAERPLTSDEIRALQRHMEAFLTEWQSHGREVTPSWQLLYDRFVVIGADEANVLVRLGDSLLAAGRAKAAQESWKEALAIFEQINHPDAERVRAKLDQLILTSAAPDGHA